jgi:hypothetical protein
LADRFDEKQLPLRVVNSIKPLTPPGLDHAIRRCLAKEPERRWQSAADLAAELEWIVEAGFQAGEHAPSILPRKLRARLGWVVAAIIAFAFTVTLAILYRATRPIPASLIRFSVDLGNEVVEPGWGSGVAISPDGSKLVFVSHGPNEPQRLFVQAQDGATPTPVPGTENARAPFFPPDGQWVAFFADGKLKKIPAKGGVPTTLCDAPSTRGGSLGEDGNIVFAPSNRSPLFSVPSAGGIAKPVTQLRGEWTDRFPQVLAGAKAFLFTSCQTLDFEACAIEAQSLSTGQRKVLVHGGYYMIGQQCRQTGSSSVTSALPTTHPESSASSAMGCIGYNLRVCHGPCGADWSCNRQAFIRSNHG